MRLRRMIITLAAAASLGLAAAPAYAASAAPAKAAADSTAQTGSHSVSLLSPGTHGSPAVGRIPLIQFRECSGQTTTWVDIDLITEAGLADWCFGYRGTWQFNFPHNNMRSFCAGNNYGYYYYTRNGVMQPAFHFGPGTRETPQSNDRLKSLTIDGWQGNYRCYS